MNKTFTYGGNSSMHPFFHGIDLVPSKCQEKRLPYRQAVMWLHIDDHNQDP